MDTDSSAMWSTYCAVLMKKSPLKPPGRPLTLEIHGPGPKGLLLRMNQKAGHKAELEVVVSDLISIAEEWADTGLTEWINSTRCTRLTASDDPLLFPRLKAYIEGQLSDVTVRLS